MSLETQSRLQHLYELITEGEALLQSGGSDDENDGDSTPMTPPPRASALQPHFSRTATQPPLSRSPTRPSVRTVEVEPAPVAVQRKPLSLAELVRESAQMHRSIQRDLRQGGLAVVPRGCYH